MEPIDLKSLKDVQSNKFKFEGEAMDKLDLLVEMVMEMKKFLAHLEEVLNIAQKMEK